MNKGLGPNRPEPIFVNRATFWNEATKTRVSRRRPCNLPKAGPPAHVRPAQRGLLLRQQGGGRAGARRRGCLHSEGSPIRLIFDNCAASYLFGKSREALPLRH